MKSFAGVVGRRIEIDPSSPTRTYHHEYCESVESKSTIVSSTIKLVYLYRHMAAMSNDHLQILQFNLSDCDLQSSEWEKSRHFEKPKTEMRSKTS